MRDPVLDAVVKEEEARRAAHRAPPEPSAATPASGTPAAPSDQARTVGVRGITGSLTAFEVEETMNTQRAQLLACVARRPRALGHVAGDIAFHFDVDGEGKVERVLVTQSDIGYAPLENCLAEVVAAAPFRPPAGAQRAEAQWRMSVDPLRRPAEPLENPQLQDTIARHAEATYESCEIGKGRRFVVTGYLGRARKLHPVSVRAPWRGPAKTVEIPPEQATCLEQALEKWKSWPKARGHAKVSFELRWVAAPPPRRKGGRIARAR